MRKIVFLILICINCCYGQDKAFSWAHFDVAGVGVDLPDFFLKGAPDKYKTWGFPNTVSKNISLSIECLKTNAQLTPAGLESYYSDCQHFFDSVVYDHLTPEFFVLSGFDKDGRVLYIKGLKKDGAYFEFDLSYDKKYQSIFNKTLAKMSASFK